MVTKETFKTIKSIAMEESVFPPTNSEQRLTFRNIMYDVIQNELIPVPLFSIACAFSIACYDESGKGYNGIKQEINTRLSYAKANNQPLPLFDFFKRPATMEDILYDDRNTEVKSGCGNWFYSKYRDLDMVRKEMEETQGFIKWDYTYTKKKDDEFNFSIHIFTDWKTFFAFLDEYDKGYKTFFKHNKAQSIKSGCNVYEMNTLKNSKRKVKYLRSFANWLEEREE